MPQDILLFMPKIWSVFLACQSGYMTGFLKAF